MAFDIDNSNFNHKEGNEMKEEIFDEGLKEQLKKIISDIEGVKVISSTDKAVNRIMLLIDTIRRDDKKKWEREILQSWK